MSTYVPIEEFRKKVKNLSRAIEIKIFNKPGLVKKLFLLTSIRLKMVIVFRGGTLE